MVNGGEIGVNYIASSVESEKIVANNNVLFDNIELQPNEMGTLSLRFNFLTEELTDKTKFSYHIIQRDIATNEIVGGKTFEIRKEQRDLFTADAGDDKEIDIDETLTINSIDIDEIATYNWYDTEGNLIYTGKDLTITPEITKKYKLEVIADSDGFKDYDEIEVTVNPFVLQSLVPNPANNQIVVNYKAHNTSSAYLMIIGTNNGTSNSFVLNTSEFEIIIDISSYQTGFYTVALVCDSEIVDAKTMIKE